MIIYCFETSRKRLSLPILRYLSRSMTELADTRVFSLPRHCNYKDVQGDDMGEFVIKISKGEFIMLSIEMDTFWELSYQIRSFQNG